MLSLDEAKFDCPIPLNVLKLVAIRSFSKIMQEVYPRPDHVYYNTKALNTRDRQILFYVGGCIVHKLSTRYKLHPEKLECIMYLRDDSNSTCSAASFTKLKSRGGLVFLKDGVLQFFELLECTFVSLFNVSHDLSVSVIHAKMISAVEQDFMKYMSDLQTSDDVVGMILRDIVRLFYKIRIHHRCKIIMEQHVGQKKKGLRKSLKM